MLLGDVLREQAGEPLFDAVEDLRRTAIARREAESTTGAEAAEWHLRHAFQRVEALSQSSAYQLARAFGFYFELINLAETNHRKRRRLSSQLNANAEPQRGSLRGTLRACKAAGFDAEQAQELLRRICISPVFTAHPTEVGARSARAGPDRRDHRALAD
jgi:phosphoenolpyruvate carboxylase